MTITINREFKVFNREVWTRFVVTVENNGKIASDTVFAETLESDDAANIAFINGLNDDNYSDDRDWTKDKSFSEDCVYDSIKAFEKDGWNDEYNNKLLKAIKKCEEKTW